MKLLITTRSDDNLKAWNDLTHPLFRKYATKVGADFQVLSHISDCAHGDGKWHYRIMRHHELHNKYDRILHLDTDMLLTPSCPNLFSVVQEGKIGTIHEDIGTRKAHRRNLIAASQAKWGDVNWKEGYINTGVILTSRVHQNIFTKNNGQYWVDFGFDDVHLGYNIARHNHPVQQLSFKFNHMTMFSERWNKNADRFDSHIIHYAGRGTWGAANKLQQARDDYLYLYKKS